MITTGEVRYEHEDGNRNGHFHHGWSPMILWLVLGASGVLGDFGTSVVYEVIKWVLIGLTMVFYFIISPFILWPRIFNGSDD